MAASLLRGLVANSADPKALFRRLGAPGSASQPLEGTPPKMPASKFMGAGGGEAPAKRAANKLLRSSSLKDTPKPQESKDSFKAIIHNATEKQKGN